MAENLKSKLNNELNQNKFKLSFLEIPNTEILCIGANVPGVDANSLEIANPHNKIYVQGNKLSYSPFTLTFKIDENLDTYKELYAWILSIYAPQSYAQYKKFQDDLKLPFAGRGNRFGFDASLFTLKNSDLPNMEIFFANLFPTSLSSIDFNYSNSDMTTANITFMYDYYLFR